MSMADSVNAGSDASSAADQSEPENDNFRPRDDQPVKIRAKSARDLVRSQEKLVEMLQNMRSDLSKIEREAIRIKEDVVKSNQLVDIVVKKKNAHHLSHSMDGYNPLYAIPKTIYPAVRHTNTDVNIRYLNQLSSFKPPESRRSTACSWDSGSRCGRRYSTSTHVSSRRSARTLSTDDNYSGTESDYDTSSRYWWPTRTRSNSSISQYSTEVAESSTESMDTVGLREQYERRRSSYYCTVTRDTQEQALSDDIDL